jgi:ribosome biogenesis GTPase / thiamine phosphate phosphatase
VEATVTSSVSNSSTSASSSASSSSSSSSSLEQLGYHPSFSAALLDAQRELEEPWLVPARVVAHLGERLLLAGATARHATVSGRLSHHSRAEELPTTGDWVAISDAAAADQLAVVHRVLSRRTAMIRRAAGRRGEGQPVAANVDTFVVVTSANRDANPRRLERYLAAIWDSGARPLVAVNKIDLCPPERLASVLAELEAAAPHVGVHPVSAQTGEGFAELLAAAAGPPSGVSATLAFVGMSGVGKSSLVNRLLGSAPAETEDGALRPPSGQQHTLPIDENDRGRHATTRRELFLVAGAARALVVIDTPGMRSLGLVEDEGGLGASFAEIAEAAASCRFADCRHTDEPGCAVLAALAHGELDPDRLASLRKLEREVRAAEARRDPLQGANAKRRMKTIHVAQRARYKLDPKSSK